MIQSIKVVTPYDPGVLNIVYLKTCSAIVRIILIVCVKFRKIEN